MEPANILFVIAFIGIPIAFGIWALVSRRELQRMPPPAQVADSEQFEPIPEQPATPEPARQPDPQPESQPTRLMPAAANPVTPAPQPSQPTSETQATRLMPATPEPAQPVAKPTAPEPEPEATRPMPATPEPAPPETEQQEPQPEPQETRLMAAAASLPTPPPPGQSYRSGTTEELPIIELPDSPRPETEWGGPIRPRQSDWQFQPIRLRLARLDPAPRRPFYPPRYAGKSGGSVKRLTPRAARSFLGPAVGLRRQR